MTVSSNLRDPSKRGIPTNSEFEKIPCPNVSRLARSDRLPMAGTGSTSEHRPAQPHSCTAAEPHSRIAALPELHSRIAHSRSAA